MLDYLAAARRHLSDGDYLSAAGRRANASQLWAYGAECAMKAILLKLGHLRLKDGKPEDKAHRKHINDPGDPLVADFVSSMSGRAAYMLPSLPIFVGWTINERYEDGSTAAANHASHANDKRVFQHILEEALKNGHA